ncbi:hypothetical protein SNOG_05603 [Parastagonospora nodorum SN15]|uniref:Uncharacterized protein n=1 Tax=Phaeosphaeria nodorum (strain SN15 / ATCC MYA-4574 / FGSC 10173) TaxID=321614 RepID=Q0URL1_PHANO|nr:hypothetical protein SNOG_05603 [Parastagonospora nodorum SN15]EAT86667.1 hypothetical protein SNOG_05603 [Parastagonospora nodorum SN15]
MDSRVLGDLYEEIFCKIGEVEILHTLKFTYENAHVFPQSFIAYTLQTGPSSYARSVAYP